MKDKIKKNSEGIRFISAIISGLIVTVCTAIVSSPYFWGHSMIERGNSLGWWVIILWTWVLYTFAFHIILRWIDKGREKAKEKELDKMARDN